MKEEEKIMEYYSQNFTEIWKPIKGFPQYEVSNIARVKNIEGNIVLSSKKGGTAVVTLKRGKVYYYRQLGVVVAEAFVPNPYHRKKVCYINGDACDCLLHNLQWQPRKMRKSRKILKIKEGITVQEYASGIEAAEVNGIRPSTLYQYIGSGRKYKGYIYEYGN